MNPALKNLLRPHYITLQGYVSAGMEVKKDPQIVFMNANENPFELPGLEGFNRYPEPQPEKLLKAYADLYGALPDNIIATRGADEAIVILTKLFCEPGKDSILIHSPTFGMYPVNARAMPGGVVEVPLIKKDGDFKLDVEGVIRAVKLPPHPNPPPIGGRESAQQTGGGAIGQIKLIFLCNPNNPTATFFPHDDIARICRETEGYSIVLLDETYAEFSAQGSFVPRMKDHPNLIILRTLSKSYSLAGMRMGCFLCADTEFIALCRAKALDAYPLPHESINAALKVMEPATQKIARENIKKLLTEKDRLIAAFKQSPLTVHIYPSDANFFLVELKDAKGFLNYCAQAKIILRDFSGKPLTENCLRISAGTPAQNDRLIALLNQFGR